jgi:hypothetical protein
MNTVGLSNKMDEMGRACSTNMGRYAYRILLEKSEGKRPIGISRRR